MSIINVLALGPKGSQDAFSNFADDFEGWEVEEDSTFGSIPNYGLRCTNPAHDVISIESRDGFMSISSLFKVIAEHLPTHWEIVDETL